MKNILVVVLCMCAFNAMSQLTDQEVHYLKSNHNTKDTSPIYELPFPKGKKYLLLQAYNSTFSHKEELALDFKMRIGSMISAARAGIVIESRADSKVGGFADKYMNEGNYIYILHQDSSVAIYWHLKENGVKVQIGDRLNAGDNIALSGNTGYSATPHLHFQVYDKFGKQIATRFKTRKGVRYLRSLRKYRR